VSQRSLSTGKQGHRGRFHVDPRRCRGRNES
jgi:hypothetical protein